MPAAFVLAMVARAVVTLTLHFLVMSECTPSCTPHAYGWLQTSGGAGTGAGGQ